MPIIQLGGAASIQANFSGADTVIIATIVRKFLFSIFARPGIEDLTSSDRITSQFPYSYRCEHLDTFFFNVISKGLSGIMPAFEGQISEEDRWNILNYLRATFSATPALQ